MKKHIEFTHTQNILPVGLPTGPLHFNIRTSYQNYQSQIRQIYPPAKGTDRIAFGNLYLKDSNSCFFEVGKENWMKRMGAKVDRV